MRLDRVNFSQGFRKIVSALRKRKTTAIDITFDTKKPVDFFTTAPLLYSLINRFEKCTSIVFFNLPYCVLPDAEEHIINLPATGKTKSGECGKCRFSCFCGGFPESYPAFHKDFKVRPVADSLKQVCIETTNRCNLDCFFCFNRPVYGNKEKTLDTEKVFSVIRQAKKMGVERIRFTGGEPLLDENLLSYISYAKEMGLSVWLNSNGTLTNRYGKKLLQGVDSVLLPLHHHSDRTESRITACENSLIKKIRTIRRIRKLKPELLLRTGTTLNSRNLGSLEKTVMLIKKLKVVPEFYRVITDNLSEINPEETTAFYRKAKQFHSRHGERLLMANAFPFCFFDNPDKARLFSLGGIMDDGRDRLIIDAEGKAKPVYYSREAVGTWKNIRKAWDSSTMKNLRELRSLPEECRECRLHPVCKGGSRAMAKAVSGSYSGEDPLISLKNRGL
jgi:cyclic pyranopterin phosphate synthase